MLLSTIMPGPDSVFHHQMLLQNPGSPLTNSWPDDKTPAAAMAKAVGWRPASLSSDNDNGLCGIAKPSRLSDNAQRRRNNDRTCSGRAFCLVRTKINRDRFHQGYRRYTPTAAAALTSEEPRPSMVERKRVRRVKRSKPSALAEQSGAS